MKRYFKLYIVYLKRAINSRLEYKKDAFIGIFSFVVSNIMHLLSLMFIVRSIPSLNGWSTYELGFLYGFTMLPKAFDHLFTDSLWYVAFWYVRTGEMDRFLIRPVNVLFQVIAEVFQPEAFGELILGISLLVTCGLRIDVNWSIGGVLVLIVATLFGAAIITAIKLITCSVAFWTKRSGHLTQITYNVSDFAKYPIDIYHPAIRFVMMYVVPFGLIITVPVTILLKGGYNPFSVSLTIISLAVVLNCIGYFIWNMGLKRYESAGS
ncbi:MAG: ABC-2 family transporter protein [Lachnospiraceae bacterium]|nr:ABC-2 family transporter protein [Lachnospiraceae bacterium]